jgi:DNA-directed RNA polymerase III subunit RPC6
MHCVRRLNGGRGVSLHEILEKMEQAKVSRVPLSLKEVEQLVQTLIYDFQVEETDQGFVQAKRISTMCEFKWWDALEPDFHFRTAVFEDGVILGPHEPHYHTA